MPNSIRKLPARLINQIAAGEVIERPASVVKELVENSLDAGARRIEIDIEQGGIRLIRIRDDGSGIEKAELALALERHATSKIASLEELEQVRSMGFRGEALPSIASVTRLALTSRDSDSGDAWRVTSDGQEVSVPALASHVRGTTVEVRDLFFNTPARRKFLRTEKTEFTHLSNLVRRLALSRFDVDFRLRHNQREVFRLPIAGDRCIGRAAHRDDCAARLSLKTLCHISHEAAGMALQGWLALPTFSRSQADLQYFYVNGRMVRDKVVSHAVRTGLPGRALSWTSPRLHPVSGVLRRTRSMSMRTRRRARCAFVKAAWCTISCTTPWNRRWPIRDPAAASTASAACRRGSICLRVCRGTEARRDAAVGQRAAGELRATAFAR